jgi:hypothetical protein
MLARVSDVNCCTTLPSSVDTFDTTALGAIACNGPENVSFLRISVPSKALIVGPRAREGPWGYSVVGATYLNGRRRKQEER